MRSVQGIPTETLARTIAWAIERPKDALTWITIKQLSIQLELASYDDEHGTVWFFRDFRESKIGDDTLYYFCLFLALNPSKVYVHTPHACFASVCWPPIGNHRLADRPQNS